MEKIQSRRTLRFVQAFSIMLCIILAWKWHNTFYYICIGDIFSDVPAHIKLALGHNDYGLSSYIIRALYAMGDELKAQSWLSVILTVNHVLGIFTLCALICYVLPKLNRWYAFLAAELALLCGPWLIPGYQMDIYLGAHNGNMYHNMTVLFSRTLIPICFIFFFRLRDARHGKIKAADWLCFMLSFLIITLFKPNFAFAFIPMLAGMLIYDFIKYRAKYFKNEVITGFAVVPAGLTCIWQYLVLYDDSFAGTSSGIAIGIFMGMSLFALTVMYLRCLLLPIYTFILQGRREENRRFITTVVLCDLVALTEASFLTETGFRANDGNFEWGGLAIYPTVFALAIGLLFRMIQTANRHNAKDVIKCLIGVGILVGHLLVGIYFYNAYNWCYSFLWSFQ